MSVEDYLEPIEAVSDYEFDKYLTALETELKSRLGSIPERRVAVDMGFSEVGGHDEYSVERALYSNMLASLEDIETPTELKRYAEQELEEPGTEASVFGKVLKIFDYPYRRQRADLMQEVFEDAKEDLDTRGR